MQKLSDLRAHGRVLIDSHEVDILLMEIFGINKISLVAEGDKLADKANVGRFRDALARRTSGMPIQYILGKWEFMGLTFEINPDVLIPRDDTEFLVHKVLEEQPAGAKGLEIGLGSGCISIALVHHGNLKMTGVDICEKALSMAKANFKCIVGAPDNFIQSDLFTNLPPQKFDFIVSNPPYINTADIAGLDCSVKNYEPAKALDGGADGLDFYRQITSKAKNWLVPGGKIYFEIGHNQGGKVRHILQEGGFANISITKDLSGHDRVVAASV
ncbi:MAG: peptide chain release factor N(5)-glutamine methyltransferase [Defluviitaleaceae bacterium]|nr:peptide chain release factor N(5)-glutamine methyltransferase [Defluviitaleaceae bacterium]